MTATGNKRNLRDPLILLVVIAVSGLVIGGLNLLARNADSAGSTGLVTDLPVPELAASVVCQNWASYWTTQSGVDAPPEALELLGNCRQTTDGTWIVPDGPADTRLVRPIALTSEQAAATAQLRTDILTQLSRAANGFPPALRQGLNTLYNPTVQGVQSHVKSGVGIGATRKAYSDYLTTHNDDPEFAALVAYIRWAIAERTAALDQITTSCARPELQYLAQICGTLRDDFSIDFAPWPWDLENDLLLQRYLLAVATGDEAPPAGYLVTTATPVSTTID